MSRKGKILVAMSGGIDSTIAAMMLHNEGYEVVGVTMKTWDYESSGGRKKETGCCSLDAINDARQVAVKGGFHHLLLDIRKEFGDYIINNFVEEYLSGRTPNPCVLCNTHIKWEALLKRADQLDCEYIATGHYAQVRKENSRYIISKGVDETKDQSYVLWGLSQQCLSRTLFPLGKYLKSKIKQMAIDNDLLELAEKSESYEICFVPDDDYRGFLKRKVEGLEHKVKNGNFVDIEGKVLGQHKGYPFYTIGQRKGLEISLGEPMYVIKIHPDTNTVILGKKENLQKQEMWVEKPNLIKYETLDGRIEATTTIRYKDKGTPSTITHEKDGTIKVLFHKNISAIAPGQSAVFYEDGDVIGGGIILK